MFEELKIIDDKLEKIAQHTKTSGALASLGKGGLAALRGTSKVTGKTGVALGKALQNPQTGPALLVALGLGGYFSPDIARKAKQKAREAYIMKRYGGYARY